MQRIHDGLAYKDFTIPSSVVQKTICTETGKLAVSGCPSLTEYFDKETVVKESCPGHRSVEPEEPEDDQDNTDRNNGGGTDTPDTPPLPLMAAVPMKAAPAAEAAEKAAAPAKAVLAVAALMAAALARPPRHLPPDA